MSIEEIIQRLQTAMDDAREHESHFESWLIQNEGICDAIDALKEIYKSQRQPLTDEGLVRAAQSCLSPHQYNHFEALLENDPDAHNRLSRAIENERGK